MTTALRVVLAKLRALFRRGRDDAGLAEELTTHLDLLVEDLRREGLRPDEARRQARLRFGGIEQVTEAARDQRGVPWLETLARDLRLGLRTLRRSPSFTLTATLSLAVGIAANTVAFAFLYGYSIRPLPFTDGARLVNVLATAPARGQDRWSTSLDELRVLEKGARSFDAVAAHAITTLDLTGAGEPRRLWTSVVSPHFLQMIGIRPMLGRLFRKDDATETLGGAALLSEGLWRSTFNADPAIVGRSITLSGQAFSVVGVLPAWPAWSRSEVYVPIGAARYAQPDRRDYRFVAHLAPGATIDQANRELEVLSAAMARESPASNAGVRLLAESLRNEIIDDEREPVVVLYAVGTLLLVLACANVATLLVMRSLSRSGEFAIRASLGAGRVQIVRQVLAEHALVTLAGGGLGLLVGTWARDSLEQVIGRSGGPLRFDLDVPGTALLALVVLAFAFLFAAISAWSVARRAFVAPHVTRVATPGFERARLRTGLATFEIALAVLVLIGTGLVLKGALRLARQPAGLDARNVLTMEVNLPPSQPEPTVQFFRTLVERVGGLPQVQSVSAVNPPPYIGWSVACEAEGGAPVPDGPGLRAMDAVVMPGYFRTLRIPLLQGRDVSAGDVEGYAPPVVVVSERFAKTAWPDGHVLGRRVRFKRTGEPDSPWLEVVGVVAETRASTFTAEGGWVYMPHGQRPFNELILMMRFKGDPASLIRDVQRLVWKQQPGLPMHWNFLLEDLIAQRYWQPRVLPALFSILAALAFAVALVGVYGVVAYASAGRTREFGIRLAMGSPPADIRRLVARQGLRLALAGTLAGSAAAFGLMHLASAVFFGVSPTDAWVYTACGAATIVAVMSAGAGPAFRAARIDPAEVLRCE